MPRPLARAAFSLAIGLWTASALAADDPFVRITQPADGATLDSMAENKVFYDVRPGDRGDHVHLYVDDREIAVLRQMQGSYPLETLPPGAHDICIRIVNKAHVPTGVQDCVVARVE